MSQHRPPPCPGDVVERSAIVQEGNGCSCAAADAAALSEFGFASWGDFADVLARKIERSLPTRVGDGAAPILLRATRRFLSSPFWLDAITAGWSMPELFGVDPAEPFADRAGLVVDVALRPLPGARLIAIGDAAARFVRRDGTHFDHQRFVGLQSNLVPWWRCPALCEASAMRVAA